MNDEDQPDSGLDDLRSRLRGPVRHDDKSIKELLELYLQKMHEIERLHHQLSSRLDAAFPGADVNRHHDDHEELYERRANNIQLRRTVIANTLVSLLIGILGVLGYFLVFLPLHK